MRIEVTSVGAIYLIPAILLDRYWVIASIGMMATVVLVHGAFHGGWCWRKLLPLLREADHDVFTPTLTGLGERAHLLSKEIDLETHIMDIVQVLEFEDLSQVTLVGHSYGGVVITGVADRIPHRVAALVHLDASVPRNGESLVDVHPRGREMQQRVATNGAGWLLPVPDDDPLFGITDERDLQMVRAKLTPMPFKPQVQPLRLSGHGSAIPKVFVRCVPESPADMPTRLEGMLSADPSWRYRELAAGHDAMITSPEPLARLLLEVIASGGTC